VTRPDLLPALAPQGRLALTQEELIDWGRRFGRQVTPPLIVALRGDLGAGKTTLARAICEGFGVQEDVTSPTFAIVHEYHAAKAPVYHLDLYRLERRSELQNVGWDDIMQADALVLIEWPDRAGDLLPPGHVAIELSHVEGDATRRVLYAGGHQGYATDVR
jgi:tRNA threonylcarbamoyladenosine biosynthesis protein TsaE